MLQDPGKADGDAPRGIFRRMNTALDGDQQTIPEQAADARQPGTAVSVSTTSTTSGSLFWHPARNKGIARKLKIRINQKKFRGAVVADEGCFLCIKILLPIQPGRLD